jgi:glutamate 5-kinase
VGVKTVRGEFQRGDVIYVFDQSGKPCALGRCAYAADEITRVKRMHTNQIESVLGYLYAEEMIHHDDLVFLSGKGG